MHRPDDEDYAPMSLYQRPKNPWYKVFVIAIFAVSFASMCSLVSKLRGWHQSNNRLDN